LSISSISLRILWNELLYWLILSICVVDGYLGTQNNKAYKLTLVLFLATCTCDSMATSLSLLKYYDSFNAFDALSSSSYDLI